MKKFFTLAAALFMMTAASAQNDTKKDVEVIKQEYVQEFLDNYVMARGVSSDGRYVFGNVGADVPGCIYDTQTGDPMIIFEPEKGDMTLGVNVIGVTYDGIAFISENDISYMYNLKDGTKTYLKSPSETFGMDLWDISADGTFLAGNVTSEDGFFCEPLYGEKQADGSYKFTQLDYPKEDAMGCIAQFSQARFISEDGNYIMGIQADARGMAGRLVVWTRQDDGSFTYSMPLDDIIYDKSVGQPGETPEYEDYVTADSQTEPELFDQQYNDFLKAFTDFENKYNDFTRHAALDIFMMHRAKKDGVIYTGLDVATIPEGSDVYEEVTCHPIMFDCDNGLAIYNDKLVGHAFEQLPGGGYITFDNSSQMFYKTDVVKEDGTSQEFSEWFNELTGVDLSQDFYFEISNPFTGQEFIGVFVGLPYFSHDGKTLMLASTDEEFNLCTGVFNFDRDIFALTSTGIKPNLLSKTVFADNKLNIGNAQGTAVVYNTNGEKCGEYTVNGSADLSGMAPGAYIINVKAEGNNTTLKVIIK